MFRQDWLRSITYKSFGDTAFFLRHYPWVRRQRKRLMNEIDLDEFARLGRKPQTKNFNPLYLNLWDTMTVALYRIRRLCLDTAPPLDILDIGTGPGVFPYVCQQFGHRVVCTDIDATSYYNDLATFFGLDRRIWRVLPHEPAPDLGRVFDLITATNIGFNKLPGKPRKDWFVEEWRFFLEDIATRLAKPEARIYLTINQMQRARGPEQRRADASLLGFFAACGARFPSYGHILFEGVGK